MAADSVRPYPLRNQAIAALTLCCVGWAFSFPTMKALGLAAAGFGSDGFFLSSLSVGLRFVLASLVILLFRPRAVSAITRSELKQGSLLGVFCTLGLILQMDGLRYTDASVAAFLTQGYCLWIPLWQALRSRRWPGWHIWGSVAMVAMGSAVLAGVSLSSLRLGRGELENLAGSVFFAGQILWLERPEFAANSSPRFTLVMFAVVGLSGVGLARVQAPNWSALAGPGVDRTSLILMGVMLAASTLVPFLTANRWQKEIPAAEAGLVYCAEPVFTSLVSLVLPGLYSGWFGLNYPNERPGWNLALGGGLILAANLWLQWADRRRQP